MATVSKAVKKSPTLQIPNHIMFGRVYINSDRIVKNTVEYQGWLSLETKNSTNKHWGNFNASVNLHTLEYEAWLDYGKNADDDNYTTKKFKGKIRNLSQSEFNRIGKRAYDLYPYKETLGPLVSAQRKRIVASRRM